MKIQYGKASVRFYRTDADGLFAGDIALDISGDRLRDAWTTGDNTAIVATDSMKNFIHAAALEYRGGDIEGFSAFVARRFLATYPHVGHVRVRGRELPFAAEGPISYSPRFEDYGVAEFEIDAGGLVGHRCGRESLKLVKLTGSSFAGFIRDAYTTLPEAHDRPLFIYLDAHWRHREFDARVPSLEVRAVIVETFDAFVSESIQQLVHEIGRRLLERFPSITEVAFEAENRLWDSVASADGGRRVVHTDPRPAYGTIGLVLGR
ncbi:MAG TPA: urate oxidase [bacterium]|nr:urate oxidase [bacterium]